MRVRWLQASTVVAVLGALVARAAPRPDPEGQPAETAKPAGSSPIESADVPAWQPSPPRFAVTPLENHTASKTLDWIVAEAPFEIAEKTEALLGLEPTGGSLFVGGVPIPADEPSVGAFGARAQVPWVSRAGSTSRRRPNLRPRLRAVEGAAGRHREARRAGAEVRPADDVPPAPRRGARRDLDEGRHPRRRARAAVARAVDDYPVCLFGHGLAHLTGAAGTVDLKPPSTSSSAR